MPELPARWTDALRVLLVDPDDARAEAIERQLELEDEYRVDHVTTVRHTMEALRARDYDCALVSHQLPDGTAIELLQATGVAGRIPVLLLTSEADPTDSALEAMQFGAADLILESEVSSRALSRAIHAAVERHRLLELRTRLHHAERFHAIGRLATGVAHGINNPAAALMTYLGMLLDNVSIVRARLQRIDDDVVPGLVAEIEDFAQQGLASSRRICEMVSYLEAFSRAERETPESLSVATVVRVAGGLSRSSLPPGVQLVKELDDSADIIGHRARLCGAVVALVTNAGESFAGVQGGEHLITLRTRCVDDRVLIEVEDNGRGMPREVAERAVEPFFTTARDRGHVGLGLAVCADVVAGHGGSIAIDSQPGRGTRVTLTLPLDTGLRAAAAEPPAAPPTAPPAEAPARVLVIDDDPHVRPALARLLRRRYQVTEADGGARALELLAGDDDYDAILCDLVMPEVDGPAVYEYASVRRPKLAKRFVFLTGAAFGERAQAFVDNAEVPVLRKPASRDRLFETIDRLVAGT